MIEPKPIDTAPRDGTPFLGFYRSARADGATGWIETWWFSSPKEIDDGWETPLGFLGDCNEPIYWLPLPKHPEDDLV